MKNFVFNTLIVIIPACIHFGLNAQVADTPVKIAIAGTTHGHAGWILGKKDKQDVVVAGIFERNKQLVKKQIKEYGLPEKIFYNDLNKMLDEIKPTAVVAFGSIYEHMEVVEACAPRGIHVMVEKPLAVSVQHAKKMESLAKEYRIHLLTNYETSWYPTTSKVSQLVTDSNYIGKIRKAVFHHGHEGPKEIGVGDEFFNWLTDPVQNGGGALVDFGCYGANIMTNIMGNVKPVSVTAVTNRFKPEIYPKVDDEATIIIEYPGTQGIIQASWNWPFGRKDMEIYGDKGYLITYNATHMKRRARNENEHYDSVTVEQTGVYTDPFKYFADVLRNKIKVPEHGYYSLSNNLMVVQILEAARESARTGKKIMF